MAYDISDLLANITSKPLDPTALAAAGWTPSGGLLSGDLTSLPPGQQPNFNGQISQALGGLLGAAPYGAVPPPSATSAPYASNPPAPSSLPPQPPQQAAAPSSGREGLLGYVGGPLQALGGLLGIGIGNAQPQSQPQPQPQPQPQGQPTNASQQPSFMRKVGDVLMLPLNVLAAESEGYAATPSNIAMARQMRQTALDQAQLNLQRQRAMVRASSGLLDLLGGDGSSSGQTQSPPSSAPGPQGGPPPPTPSPQGPTVSALQSQGDAQGPQAAPQGAPRGLRNMNPGNVRALPNGQAWQGQTGIDDQGYAQFGAMQDGIRASLLNLHNYGQLHGINTVQGVIDRWSRGAPAAYAQTVAAGLGVKPTDRIDLNDPNTLTGVGKGIFSFENGGWGDQSQTQAVPNAPQPNGPPGASSSVQGDADVAGPSTYPVQPPQIGQANSAVGMSPRFQRGLATLAIMSGQPEQAASIMSGDVAPDSSGNLVDHKTGRVLGRVQTPQYVNGYRVDPGAPDAPSYIPQNPAGTIPDGKGGVMPIPGATDAIRAQKFAETAGANDANWPGDLVSVPMGNGTTRTMSRSQFAAMMNGGNGQGTGSAPAGTGSVAGGPGVASPSAAQTEFDKDQAGDASKTISTDMDARPQALQDLDSARTALAYVQAHPNGLNPATPFKVAGANYLRSLSPETLNSLGIPAGKINQYANDVGVYQRLSAENLLTFSKSHLPSRYTEREMAVASKVIPGLTTAPDAATFHWGLQAAIANKALQRADFSANYQGAPSRQTVEQAWNTTPAGQASLFEDPTWQGLKIGGKPAVVFTRDPKSGRTVGVVGMGTSAPTTFFASGGR